MLNRFFFGTLRQHIRLVWSPHGYFGSTASRQNTNHGSTKLVRYAAEAYQKGTIRYRMVWYDIVCSYYLAFNNCIGHPFYVSFFAWLARAGARARSELDRFSMKAEQIREITGRFLLNELGDPHFLMHKFKWHTVEYDIPRFQEKLKILLWDISI